MSTTKGQTPGDILGTANALLSGKEHHLGAATQLSDFNDRGPVSLLVRGRYSIILNEKPPSAASVVREESRT